MNRTKENVILFAVLLTAATLHSLTAALVILAWGVFIGLIMPSAFVVPVALVGGVVIGFYTVMSANDLPGGFWCRLVCRLLGKL